ncbi:JAB domain-containing protein [Aquabacterium sp.]|uniref:JAB domain-containing protein n=1 Tax=Aquabacterium sp. TaxID=1872578 RepID=UPI002624B18D|nr:JAB domain-containing protein [Aquabacterium sp.]MDD2977111.1 JAB domain-containing protein [Aquabacterium sp.]
MPSSCIPRNDTDLLPLSNLPIYTRPKIVQQALRLMEESIRDTPLLTSPQAVRDYLRLRLADRPHGVFGVLFLTAQHQVIEFVEMFRGTLTQTSVYPREVVIEALSRNAAAVILTHNHPSGKTDPSVADEALTHAIKSALSVVDVHVLDHFIVTCRDVYSFAENRKL